MRSESAEEGSPADSTAMDVVQAGRYKTGLPVNNVKFPIFYEGLRLRAETILYPKRPYSLWTF